MTKNHGPKKRITPLKFLSGYYNGGFGKETTPKLPCRIDMTLNFAYVSQPIAKGAIFLITIGLYHSQDKLMETQENITKTLNLKTPYAKHIKKNPLKKYPVWNCGLVTLPIGPKTTNTIDYGH